MINHVQLRDLIIKPTLDALQLYSDDAVELLLFTCAAESDGGTYIKQVNGIAMGIYQMEPATYKDIWRNYIQCRANLSQHMRLKFEANHLTSPERMIYDNRFATAMARLHYARVSEALPDRNDIDAMWAYYKRYYNTSKGSATKEKAMPAYRRFVQVAKIKTQPQAQAEPESGG